MNNTTYETTTSYMSKENMKSLLERVLPYVTHAYECAFPDEQENNDVESQLKSAIAELSSASSESVVNSEAMTVNEFIAKLQKLKPTLREKDIVIACPNGLTVEPVVKQLLEDKYEVFGGIENVKAMIVTWE